MKMKFTDLAILSCFVGKNGDVKKKVSERKASAVKESSGKVSTRKVKGDPEVENVPCPLNLFGVGLRRHPERVIQIGDGNILERRKKQGRK